MLIMQFVSRDEWGARPPRYTNALNLSLVDKFIVHYSGAPRSQTVRSIQNYSMDIKGYSDIDYNYIVKDGLVYIGRGDNIGGHTYQTNSSSYGVCVIGQDGDATQADLDAVADLYDYLCDHVGRTLRAMGHRDANPGQTDCPGDQIENWVMAGMPHSQEGVNMTVVVHEPDAGWWYGNGDWWIGCRDEAHLMAATRAFGPVKELLKGDFAQLGIPPKDKPEPGSCDCESLVGKDLIITAKVTHAL